MIFLHNFSHFTRTLFSIAEFPTEGGGKAARILTIVNNLESLMNVPQEKTYRGINQTEIDKRTCQNRRTGGELERE